MVAFRIRSLLLCILVCAAPLELAWAQKSPDSSNIYPRIIFGTERPSLGSPVVEVRQAIGRNTTLCTGSLIASDVVLTAWHCVGRRASRMSVVVNGREIRAKQIRIHPQARRGARGILYNDVALLFLKRRTDVVPLPILNSREILPGDAVEILGFGLDEAGVLGVLKGGGTTVRRVSDGFLVTVFGRSGSDSCSGDSGGPAIYTYRDASGKERSGIVGITSTGTSRWCSFGDQTFYINLQSSTVFDFIVLNVPGVGVI